MKIAILTFISFFMLLSCHNDDCNSSEDTTFVPRNITPVLIGKGNLNFVGDIPSQQITVDDNDSWNTILNSVDEYSLEEFTETTVNFNEFQLIAVFDTVYGDRGHSITITTITENRSNITVTVEKSYTPAFLIELRQPFHIVKIPKSYKPVVFQE